MSNYNQTLQTNNSSLEEIINIINNLPDAEGSGEPILQNKIITPSTSAQDVIADSGYDGLSKVTVNAMPTATQATPTVTINSSGLITATATQTAGYVAAGSKSATKQLAFQAAKTITPGTVDQTAVASATYTGGTITVKGDSNLVAGNIKSGVSIFGVTGTLATGGSGGGNTDGIDKLITKKITTCTDDRVISVGSFTFCSCSNLTSVSFPACTTIGAYAFDYCSNLTSVSFPTCTTIGSQAFRYCSRLTSVSFPVCTTINGYAFGYCSRLVSVNFPACTTIDGYAFCSCSKLTSVSFPACTILNSNAFYKCSKLTSVSFPACTTISSYAFMSCSNLTSVNFPACTKIYSSAFANCTKLNYIYLMNSVICNLLNSNAFSYAGITRSKGYIYVPSSLLTSYKTATNWTYFSNRIFAGD